MRTHVKFFFLALIYTLIVYITYICLYVYRAADWNLSTPDWSGRLRVVALGEKCTIKLEDKVSGMLFICIINFIHNSFRSSKLSNYFTMTYC